MSTMKFSLKPIFNKLFVGVVVLTMAISPSVGFAQVATPESPAEEGLTETIVLEAEDEYSFETLGLVEQTLNAPYDDMQVRFSVPPDWALSPGATIQLDLAFYYDVQELSTPSNIVGEIFGGLLQVVYNGVTLTSILLDERGDQSFTVPISARALESDRGDGRHELRLFLISDESCLYGVDTIVVVKPTSRFYLPHTNVAIDTDLSILPRPIFQFGSIAPDQAAFVIPDQPSTAELSALLSVAAGFGRLTNEELIFSVVNSSGLTPEIQNNSHLVFVGKPVAFPSLGNVTLPANPTEFTAPEGTPSDGILQMTQSPWNASKAVLVISGDTDEGVVKAAQAFSSGFVFGVEQPNLARIAEVNPIYLTTVAAANRTFADLGYLSDTVEYFGLTNREVEFYIPPGQVPDSGSYAEVHFAHSTFIAYERSGLTIELNGSPIGSANFTDETAQGSTLRVILPRDLMNPGRNRLRMVFNLVPEDVCAEFFVNNLWLTLYDDSLIHLPLLPLTVDFTDYLLDLDLYPQFFSLGPASESLAFVLPQNDIASWQIAAQVAANIGDDTEWSLAEPAVYYSDNVPEEVRQNQDMIIVGRASNQPIIAELAGALPAPFEAGSDVATVQDLQVTYRLPAGTNLGYIELLRSPWNSDKFIMAVLGSTDVGVSMAGAALTTPELRGELAGNLALVSNEQIVSIDTNLDLGAGTDITAAVPETTINIPMPDTTYTTQRPAWVLPAIAGVIVLMIVVIVFVGISNIRSRR